MKVQGKEKCPIAPQHPQWVLWGPEHGDEGSVRKCPPQRPKVHLGL